MNWESNVLLKFIMNKCSKAEKDMVNHWLSESQQNKNTLSYLKLNLPSTE